MKIYKRERLGSYITNMKFYAKNILRSTNSSVNAKRLRAHSNELFKAINELELQRYVMGGFSKPRLSN